MSRFRLLLALIVLGVAASAFTGVAAAQETAVAGVPAKPVVKKQVRVWAYVGPRGYLGGAKVTLTDRTGKVIGTGTTSSRGTHTFDVGGKSFALPLTVSTSGGRITASALGKKVLAVPFDGHMAAVVYGATTRAGITHVNLISTAAAQIAGTRKAHDAAVAKVRSALGISKTSPDDVLQYRNSHVGFRQMIVAARRAGGFDEFATRVARAAAGGKRISGLRPTSANASAAIPARLIRAKSTKGFPARPVSTLPFKLPRNVATSRQSTAPSSTVCQVGVPTEPTTGGISDTVITDVADVGVGALMKVTGAPTAATSSITGMALGEVGVSQETAEQQDLEMIADDLDCIGDQLNYLSSQIAELQFSINIATATSCAAAIDGGQAWDGYEFLMSSDNTTPVNMSNKDLRDVYIPTWNYVRTACSGAINDALWGTAGTGTQGSSWAQLVMNTRKGGKWYSPSQIQQMQTFLSYWGTKVYQQYVLTNEYFNYNGNMDAARQSAGVTKDSAGNTTCMSSQPSSFCWVRSNIKQAYPTTLYSDELGKVSTGISYNAIPLGVFAGKAITNPASGMAATVSKYQASAGSGSGSATSVTPAWLYNYYLNWTPYDGNGTGNKLRITAYGLTPECLTKVKSNCPGPQTNSQTRSFTWDAAGWFNKLGVNPKGYGSAIQTYDNPQVTNRTPEYTLCSEVADLNSNNGLTGQKGIDALYAAMNQTGALSSVKSGDILYWANDWKAQVIAQLRYGNSVPNAYLTWQGCFGAQKSDWVGAYEYLPTGPTVVTITARPWWPGAASADTLTYLTLKPPSGPQ